MKLVELSHRITPGMPVYPGTSQPVFSDLTRLETHGFAEKELCMASHTGTHMDAPAHIVEAGLTLDRLPLDHFYGAAVCVQVSPGKAVIEPEDLHPQKASIESADFLLFHTGWDLYWGEATYFSGYPVLSKSAAGYLTSFDLKGIGFDTISADTAEPGDFPIHRILLGSGLVIIENLTRLGHLPKDGFTFSALPLRIEDADGSPVRAVGIME